MSKPHCKFFTLYFLHYITLYFLNYLYFYLWLCFLHTKTRKVSEKTYIEQNLSNNFLKHEIYKSTIIKTPSLKNNYILEQLLNKNFWKSLILTPQNKYFLCILSFIQWKKFFCSSSKNNNSNKLKATKTINSKPSLIILSYYFTSMLDKNTWKSLRDWNMAGMRKLSRAHSSIKLFCSGVPVRSSLLCELKLRSDCQRWDWKFLMLCACGWNNYKFIRYSINFNKNITYKYYIKTF